MTDRAERHVVVPRDDLERMRLAARILYENSIACLHQHRDVDPKDELPGWLRDLDSDIIKIEALLAAPPLEAEAVAWQYRWIASAGFGPWLPCDEETRRSIQETGHNANFKAEVRPLYDRAAPPVQREAVAWRFRARSGNGAWLTAVSEPKFPKPELFEVEPLYASPVPSSGRDEIIEMCAKVAEDSVHQKCCGHGRIVCDASGDPVGEDCCGSPDIEPMYPNEIAERIRSLKSQPAQEGK